MIERKLAIQVERRRGMITCVGFRSSKIRIVVSEIIVQIKTRRQRIIIHSIVEVIHSREDEMSGNDNIHGFRSE